MHQRLKKQKEKWIPPPPPKKKKKEEKERKWNKRQTETTLHPTPTHPPPKINPETKTKRNQERIFERNKNE